MQHPRTKAQDLHLPRIALISSCRIKLDSRTDSFLEPSTPLLAPNMSTRPTLGPKYINRTYFGLLGVAETRSNLRLICTSGRYQVEATGQLSANIACRFSKMQPSHMGASTFGTVNPAIRAATADYILSLWECCPQQPRNDVAEEARHAQDSQHPQNWLHLAWASC